MAGILSRCRYWCSGERDELGGSDLILADQREVSPLLEHRGTCAAVAFLGCLGDDAYPVA